MIGLTHMMSGTDTITLQQKRMNQGAHTRLRVITTSLKCLWVITTSLQSHKLSTIQSRRQELLVKYLHLGIRIFTLANVKNKHGTFEAND